MSVNASHKAFEEMVDAGFGEIRNDLVQLAEDLADYGFEGTVEVALSVSERGFNKKTLNATRSAAYGYRKI